MAKSSLIEQMLEHLVNDDAQKAEELFHEYVVKQSREIYENLIESEMHDQEDDMDEAFGDEGPMDLDGEDPTDDLAGDLGDNLDDEDGMDGLGDNLDDEDESGEENLYQDLESIIDELQAKFDELKSQESGMDDLGDDDGMDDLGDDDGMDGLGDDDGMDGLGDDDGMDDDTTVMKDSYNHSTFREYVERVPAGHGAEKKGQAEKSDKSATSLKFNKNDMGGTSSNILSGRNGADAGEWGTSGGQLKGSGLLKGGPKEMNTGNLNTVGGFKGDAYKKNSAGHGAERKGTAEQSTDGQSLFRGRR